eukprot:TRINITY_DN39534_c0_g1_i1.p1 TRINITY_DN39534_c0_g1~~TRINITY_DN39534_c0_g1_i1.p1  ORF type:complete len:160 (-),score=23.61 TRINITY_DN39534_c0_g1_i1:798-1277(-)
MSWAGAWSRQQQPEGHECCLLPSKRSIWDTDIARLAHTLVTNHAARSHACDELPTLLTTRRKARLCSSSSLARSPKSRHVQMHDGLKARIVKGKFDPESFNPSVLGISSEMAREVDEAVAELRSLTIAMRELAHEMKQTLVDDKENMAEEGDVESNAAR